MTQNRFTEEDFNRLKIKFITSKEKRRKQIIIGILLILKGIIFGILLLPISRHSDFVNELMVLSSVAAIIGLLFSIYGILSTQSIRRLKRDIDCGFKLIGESEIIKFYNFKRKVLLADGTTLMNSCIPSDKIMKGDVLQYEKTISGDFVLACEKKSDQKRV